MLCILHRVLRNNAAVRHNEEMFINSRYVIAPRVCGRIFFPQNKITAKTRPQEIYLYIPYQNDKFNEQIVA